MTDLMTIQNKIYEIRGQRVMLDRDLAEMYGVETRVLNQAVKRNKDRFPPRFYVPTNSRWVAIDVITICDDINKEKT